MKQLNTRATLADVRIRPYGHSDDGRLRRMSAHLSRDSLYTRFFSGTPQIPEHYVQAMHTLDHWNREAMTALLDGEMIGIAEYVRDVRRPCRAEIGVLIADPWQRRGLARHLVTYLAHLAERRGIREFDADTLHTNREAVLAIRSGWPGVRSRTTGGAAHFTLPLPLPVPG